jgi:hypothetical protein
MPDFPGPISDAGIPSLGPAHLHSSGGEVDVVPAQRHDLRGSEAVAVGNQDGRGIPMPGAVLLGGPMSRSTSRSVRYSRLPTVTFTEVGACLRSREFSMKIALQPTRTVTNLAGRVTESKSRDHRKRGGQHSSPLGPPPDFECQLRMRAKSGVL